MVHGGGWRSGDRSLMYPLADYLAKHGYIAIPVEYRLSPEAKYPAAVNDINNAISWIRKNGYKFQIDTNRVAILGCSAGAQLAGLVGLKYGIYTNSERNIQRRINAIVNIDGIMDFTSKKARKYEDDPSKKITSAGAWFGGRYSEKTELWKEASPLYYVNENSPPIQFINSSMPRFHIVRDEVIYKLRAYSIYSEIKTFTDAPHSFWLFDPWFERTGKYVVEFLDKVLKLGNKRDQF
jgi:acetyl esterase/lipase